MEIAFDVLNYSLSAILIGISGAWVFLIKTMVDSFRLTPYLDIFENTSKTFPKVSIILPAFNAEEYISDAIDSILNQTYIGWELIIIYDKSSDQSFHNI